MGDVYAKQGNWEQALGAYTAALTALRYNKKHNGDDDGDEIGETMATLRKKRHTAETHLAIASIGRSAAAFQY